MFPRPHSVSAEPNFRIRVRFLDGAEGVVDLSHLRGKGVFRAWDEPGFFERVYVSPECQTVTWPGELDLDPNVLYAEATGRRVPGADAAA
ncbi:MAG: DUF2442 domain-containing protein [Planctomycetes bacterium]|nr:DUF2442 domain-containing protein [Planctomycetota bacterium]